MTNPSLAPDIAFNAFMADEHGSNQADDLMSASSSQPATSIQEAATISSITKWAAQAREGFGRNRRDFNFAACDALAAAGITPTANMILRVGKWGTSTSVQADTREWYKSLASRLQSLESTIPLAARRQANLLLDQLFGVAREAANQTMSEKLTPLQQELETLNATHAEALESLEVASQDCLRVSAENVQVKEKLARSVSSRDLYEKDVMRLAAQLSAEQHAHNVAKKTVDDKLAEAHQALAEAKLAHLAGMLEVNTAADVERRRIMLAADGEKVEHAKTIQALQLELSKTRVTLESVRQDLSKTAIEAATASASLEGVKAQLAAEREMAAQRVDLLQGEEFRCTALVAFVAQSRKGGFVVAIEDENRDLGATWLIKHLRISSNLAERISGAAASMPSSVKVEKPDSTEPKKDF